MSHARTKDRTEDNSVGSLLNIGRNCFSQDRKNQVLNVEFSRGSYLLLIGPIFMFWTWIKCKRRRRQAMVEIDWSKKKSPKCGAALKVFCHECSTSTPEVSPSRLFVSYAVISQCAKQLTNSFPFYKYVVFFLPSFSLPFFPV
jgi:Na+/melibiose symporter-like transporter